MEVHPDLMRVYRVEDQNCYGPYSMSDGDPLDIPSPDHMKNKWTIHPHPEDDGIHTWPEDWKFGFKTMTDLLDWFGHPAALRLLENNRFRVVWFDADKEFVYCGGHQLAFEDQGQPRNVILWSQVHEAARHYGI